MPTPSLSVIIPTHERGDILRECLVRLEAQTARDALEVIVVSDGTMDKETAHLGKSAFQFPVRFFEIEKRQQGSARNRGVKEALGEIALFIGDDMFLDPEACERHLAAHRTAATTPMAVLGHIAWDPTLQITPVMRWLDETGWQFGYHLLAPYAHRTVPASLQHRFTYTGNISLPLTLARSFPFREDMTLYGWEDVEWGLRLREAGIPLFYEPDARALHHHAMTLEQSLLRMETLGKSAVLFEAKHPDLRIVPKGLKKFLYEGAALLPTLRGKHAKAFLRGLHS